MLIFKLSEPEVRYRRKRKCQLKPDITTKLATDVLANGANEPYLRHTHDRAKYAEAESCHGSDARWEPGGFVVVLNHVPAETLFEDEVLGKSDAFVYSQPVGLRAAVSSCSDDIRQDNVQ